MKFKNSIFASAVLLWIATPSSATLVVYDGTDPNTLHFWDLNQTSGGYTDGAGSLDLDLVAGGTRGTTAYSTDYGVAFDPNTASSGNYGVSKTGVSSSSFAGTGGAFTMEGMVKLDSLPSANPFGLINADTGSNRLFQLRLDANGSNTELEFLNNIYDSANRQLDLNFDLPTTGDHAVNTTDWFHFAVAYNGNENTTDNISFYWTKVDPSFTSANLIGSDQMTHDIGGVGTAPANVELVLGARQYSGPDLFQASPLDGSIDEVRISGVQRAADEMMFVIPEPSSFVLVGLALAGALIVRRRRG